MWNQTEHQQIIYIHIHFIFFSFTHFVQFKWPLKLGRWIKYKIIDTVKYYKGIVNGQIEKCILHAFSFENETILMEIQ